MRRKTLLGLTLAVMLAFGGCADKGAGESGAAVTGESNAGQENTETVGKETGSEGTKESTTPSPTVTPTPEPEVILGNTVEFASAQEFVESMGIGWNLGNSLDSVDCHSIFNELEYEMGWGNVRTKQKLIQMIKADGIDTIRIPVSWKNHVGAAPDYKISEKWLNRVTEIVDWCVEEDMYIILNMHHEDEWITTASTDYDAVMERYTAIWTQLAEHFGNYSNKLIFESMNEIGFDDLGTQKGCELLNKMNAEFVKLIRNSGKNNADRYLLLAGYWTDIDRSCEGIVMPEDDKVILSVHYYSPAQFAIAEKGTSWGYRETWGTEEDFTYLKGQMEKLKTNFLDKGIPVIVGEYGCTRKDKDPASRLLWLASVAEYCIDYGICPVLWDNGEEIDRINFVWRTEGLAEALRKTLE
ncbi:MAG: glycoside hydrolase family 5 protein [Lachnospiraceae bacterium]|nr:glycoside hydrolase family 5 protein [Lachnospiraceae bacterium]